MERMTPSFGAQHYEDAEFQRALAVLEDKEAWEDLTELLRRALPAMPQHAGLTARLARLYTDRYDNDAARALWERLAALGGAWRAEGEFRLGELAEREQRWAEAAARYQRALAWDVENPTLWARVQALSERWPAKAPRAAVTVGGAQGGPSLGLRAPAHYELQHPLGRGGYGVVFLARDARLGRHAAIKFLHPHLTRDARKVEAFFEEARLVARLNLPGAVRLYELVPDAHCLVMEYLTHGTLRDRLSQGRALAPAAALRVARALLDTLGRLHEAGIVHRDLKPENVLFRADGAPVLGDFGVAALEADAASWRQAGTWAYMAPEQRAQARPDRRADLYALGLILAEMLIGGLPSELGPTKGLDDPARLLALLPVQTDEGLRRALRSLLDPDPSQRPPDAAAALRALPAQPWGAPHAAAWQADAALAQRAWGASLPPEALAGLRGELP
jgi:hypothetical protein